MGILQGPAPSYPDEATTADLDVLARGIEDGMLELVRAVEHRSSLAVVS